MIIIYSSIQKNTTKNETLVETVEQHRRLSSRVEPVDHSRVPDGGLADLAVDGQVGLVVLGEGGPGNWDFAVAPIGITGQEERDSLHQFKTGQTSSYHFTSPSVRASLTSLNHFRPGKPVIHFR